MRDLMSDKIFTPDEIESESLPGPRVAYIKEISQDEANGFADFDFEARLPSEAKLYAIRSGDGKTIGITDSWAAAYWAALSNDLSPLSVH